jgi:glutamate/tyrosine decarboxylase-like PLP-dependent enzyme
VRVHIDKSVVPIAQPLRRIAYHILEKADKAYDELLRNDIVEVVNEPSNWVSNVVIVPNFKYP